jgi:hypothetical protein
MPKIFDDSVDWVLVKKHKKQEKKKIVNRILQDARKEFSIQPNPRFEPNLAVSEVSDKAWVPELSWEWPSSLVPGHPTVRICGTIS